MANKNITQLTPQVGSANTTSLFYAVTGGNTDTSLPLTVFVNNLGLTGVPTTPTASPGTNTTQIASTAFVQAAVSGGTYAASFFTLQVSGQIASTVATGTAPFVVASTTNVPNLNASSLNGATFAAPGPIGSTTASTGAFTTLSTSGAATLSSLSTSAATITGGSINGTTIGATTASTGQFTTIKATSTITPSTTAGIVGTTAGDNAQAGSVGEILTNTGTSTGLSTGTYVNLAQITLTAGDWDVTGSVVFTVSAGASAMVVGLNTTSNTNPGGFQVSTISGTSLGTSQFSAPIWRFNVTTSTTVFLGGQANFSSGTVSAQGFIRARRVR